MLAQDVFFCNGVVGRSGMKQVKADLFSTGMFAAQGDEYRVYNYYGITQSAMEALCKAF